MYNPNVNSLTHQRSALLICIIASTYTIYDFFIQVAPSVMTQPLMEGFHLNAQSLGFLGSSFFYAYALMQAPSGHWIDKWGVKKILILYSVIAALSCFLFSKTDYFLGLIVARVLAGTSVCIGFLASYSLVSQWLPHRLFSTYAAILHLLGAFGAILAQGPLALMVNRLGWRVVMQDFAILTLGLTLLYIFFVADKPNYHAAKNTNKNKQSFFHAMKYCLKHHQVKWIALCGFLGWLPVSIIGSLWGVPYLMKVYHWNNVTASKACSFFWIGSAIGAFVLCWLSEWMKSRKKPLYLAFVMAFLSSTSLVMAPFISAWITYLSLFFLGVSVCMQTMTFCIIKENVATHYFTSASGVNNVGSMFSGAIGPSMVGVLLQWHHLGSDYRYQDYQFALSILPLAALLGGWICYKKIRETHCRMINGDQHV